MKIENIAIADMLFNLEKFYKLESRAIKIINGEINEYESGAEMEEYTRQGKIYQELLIRVSQIREFKNLQNQLAEAIVSNKKCMKYAKRILDLCSPEE